MGDSTTDAAAATTTAAGGKAKGAGPGRTSTSCSECQRRKQKCDKQWPCRHCQDRRVPHLCEFKKRSNSDEDAEPILTRPLPRARPVPKRKYDDYAPGLTDSEAAEYAKRVMHIDGSAAALTDLGYIAAGRQPFFQNYLEDGKTAFTTKALSGLANRVEKPPNDPFPPRPYADVLVHNFCDNINYVYCIVHPESLLEEYARWWQTRRTEPNIELESLLLRICAISAQFVPEAICERLESELSEDIGELKHRWHEAAEHLCNTIRPGKGGVKHVQQLFLTAAYFKTEAMFVESWHALAGAVRMAQEIGMHKDSPECELTDFEREIRRSVWMSLYTWDRLMAFIFDRPAMIHRAHCKLFEPKLSLWNDPIHPELPSPILSRVCEFRLTKILDKYLDIDLTQANIRTLVRPLQDIKTWLEDLPAIFRVRDPDTGFDELHRRIPVARLSMHTTAYIALFHVLQPCLTSKDFPEGSTATQRMKLRSACMDYCLRMTDVVDRLAASASHSRFHMSFCLFETSATACAAMVKDKARELPKREDVARAMGKALGILDRLGPTTAVARSSAKILTDLTERLQVEQPEVRQFVLQGRRGPSVFRDSVAGDGSKTDSALGSSIASPESACEPAKLSPESVCLDSSLPAVEDLGISVFDMDIVNQIWDWEGFDFSIDLTAVALTPPPPPPPEVH